MSVELPETTDDATGELPEADVEHRKGPRPTAHGSSVISVFNDAGDDVDLDLDADDLDRSASTYDALYGLWQAYPGDRDAEPYVVAELDEDRLEWLPRARGERDWVVVLTSSRWKAGTGSGSDYSAYYEYHLKLRERDVEGELHKPPLAIHIEVMPQYRDLVYKDGNGLECPYGEGTRAVCWTTWADSSDEVERRLLDVLEAAVGADRDALVRARNPESRRIAKAEAHVRFGIGWKRQVIEALEQSKNLIAYGGSSEIEAHQQRQREGWLEAVVDADRWHLLGFRETSYDIELKVYQATNWADTSPNEPAHHPKLEASFAGVNGDGALPHVDQWDEVLHTLRSVVSSHLDWAGVEREHLVADDYFDGAAVPEYKYPFPANRREQLRARYEAVSTELYREALKANTSAVYDILRTLTIEDGASYDTLVERTGLARSTVRYHARRLEDAGVVKRIGNPVLVVFPSLKVLRKADDIMRSIYPEDQLEDMAERADERRERRESEDGDADDLDDDQDVDELDQDDDVRTWEYFRELGISPLELADALADGQLDEDHVRVRTDPYSWLG